MDAEPCRWVKQAYLLICNTFLQLGYAQSSQLVIGVMTGSPKKTKPNAKDTILFTVCADINRDARNNGATVEARRSLCRYG